MKRSVTIFSLRNGAGHPGAALNCLQRERERERERERVIPRFFSFFIG